MLAKTNGLFRLVRDAELIYGNSGTAILKLGLACSEKFKEKETQLFIDAVAFGKPAEIINQYAGTKGTQIFISGKLQTEQWQNQQGEKRSKVSMVVEGFEFVGKGKETQQNTAPSQQQGYQAPQQQYQQQNGQGQYQPPVQETIPQDNQSEYHPNQQQMSYAPPQQKGQP